MGAPAGRDRIYLDNNSTTAVDAEVLEAMRPWFRERFANPSSPHPGGEEAADAVRRARGEVARLVGAAGPREVVFTSGGSEGIATAFWSARHRHPGRRRVVVSSVEHSAVARSAALLETLGFERVTVPVDRDGRLARDVLFDAIDERCALVSLMLANNETGVLTDLSGVGEACRAAGATFHVDAVQGPGKVEVDARAIGCDLATVSGHKLHGPKGTGALWVRDGFPFTPLVVGGPQEDERRAGTENVPGIVGLGRAAALARAAAADPGSRRRVAALRDRLEGELLERVAGTRVHGAGAYRVPNTTNVLFGGIEARWMLLLLGAQGVDASAGSACNATRSAPSPVLLAMGCSTEEASSSLRFSLSRETTEDEIERAVEEIASAAATLRSLGGTGR